MSLWRRTGFLCTAVAILVLFAVLPAPEGLGEEGMRALGLLLATIFLLMTETLPLAVTSLAAMALMPVLGVLPFAEVWPAFGNSAVFFMIASFGISTAFRKTHIPFAIIKAILQWSRGNSFRLCLGFMSGAALVSAVISDIPTCVIFAGLALELLEAAKKDKPGISSLGRALMIAVPAGAIIGGFATPAGNGLNIMVMTAVNDMADAPLTFAQWTAVGVPVAIVLIMVCSWWINFLCKPDDLDELALASMRERGAEEGKFTSFDVRFVIVLVAMMVCWIVSSWIPAINITLVAIAGVAVMHLPGVDLLEGREFVEGVSWETVVMCGGIIALGVGVQSTGAISWIVSVALSGVTAMPEIAVLVVFSVIPCVVHLVTPAAGAIYALTCIPLLTAAVELGVDLHVVALIVGAWICITFMQPLDLVYLLTYSNRYYTTGELVRFGVLPTALLLVITVTWIPFACSFM